MIKFEHITKQFIDKKSKTIAVNDVSFQINKGEIFGIIGFSGAGKSTLVRCINLLEKPDSGRLFVDGEDITKLKESELRRARKKIGMIFQQFNLLEQRNVLDNICYPLEISGVKRREARIKAKELLRLVDISDKEKSYPSQLSGGQKQRVAIARALATNPEVLLCDEATSALDPITTKSILELLKEINQKMKVTIVVITHEMKVVEQICDRVAIMSDGSVEEIGNVKDVFERPQSETGKKIVISDEDKVDVPARDFVRIVFNGQSSSEPVLSDLILTCKEKINILGANTRDIGGSAYGQMLIERPPSEVFCKVKDYLDKKHITYEEVEV